MCMASRCFVSKQTGNQCCASRENGKSRIIARCQRSGVSATIKREREKICKTKSGGKLAETMEPYIRIYACKRPIFGRASRGIPTVLHESSSAHNLHNFLPILRECLLPNTLSSMTGLRCVAVCSHQNMKLPPLKLPSWLLIYAKRARSLTGCPQMTPQWALVYRLPFSECHKIRVSCVCIIQTNEFEHSEILGENRVQLYRVEFRTFYHLIRSNADQCAL